MDVAEISDFARLFRVVDVQHRQELLAMTGPARDLYENVLPVLQYIPQAALEALLPSEERLIGDLRDSNLYMYLRAIRDDQVAGWSLPVASLQFNFSKEPVELRIFLALAQMIDGRVRFYGFRFEAPEGSGDGRHDFYHVQQIRSFTRDGKLLNPPGTALAVVPEKQPSFPLKAECPVSLAIAFFVSLYGMPFLTELSKTGEVPEKYLIKFR